MNKGKKKEKVSLFVYWCLFDSSLEVEIKIKEVGKKEVDTLLGVEVVIAGEDGRFNKFMNSLDMMIPENRLEEFIKSISTQ
jgi:hypothetical protein